MGRDAPVIVDQEGGAPSSQLDRVLLAITGAAFAFGVFVAFTAPANHDVAWLLYVARQVSGGADLYRDVIETNPPLIVYALRPMNGLASLLNVPSMVLFRLSVLLLAAAMLGWTARLTSRALSRGAGAAMSGMFPVAVCLLVVVPGFHLGQRDHLVVLLMLPLLASAVARARGVPLHPLLAVAIGACGAVGIALKPFALVVWLGTEAYLSARRAVPLLRPETVSVLLVGAAYLLAVAIFEPEFFGFAPAALGAYRDYYPASPLILARQPSTLVAVGAILTSWIMGPGDDYRDLRRVLEVATGAFLLMVFVQNKGFLYHWIPVHAMTGLLLTTILAERWGTRPVAPGDSRPALRPRRVVRLAAAGIVLVASFWSFRDLQEIRSEWAEFSFYQPRMRSLLMEHAEGQAILALTVRLPPGLALAIDESSPVRWGSRFNVLWPIPGLYRGAVAGEAGFPYHREAERSDLEWFLVGAVTEDFLNSRPALVVVELASPRGLAGFNVLEYFQRSSTAFREELTRYQPFMRLGDYLILRRADPEVHSSNPS